MLGKHVLGDLEIDALPLPTCTPWGSTTFRDRLSKPQSDIHTLKRTQLPILALRRNQTTLDALHTVLKDQISPASYVAQEKDVDPRIRDSVEQILWSPDSYFRFMNVQGFVLSFLLVWKTLILPGIAVLLPIMAILVPYFLLNYVQCIPVSPTEYICHIRRILLQQISVPTVLRAKHSGDVMGHVLETAFLGLTGATFVSSIWTQIQSALHLREIAADLERRGKAILQLVEGVRSCVATLYSLPTHLQKAVRNLVRRGELLLEEWTTLPSSPTAAYGFVWNAPAKQMDDLTSWIGELDCLVTIANLEGICFPTYSNTVLQIHGVYHPALKSGITNHADFSKGGNVLLTGPNRGGKSTFCRSVGLAILCAQTWGFAWADRMTFTPFVSIQTALHPSDSLGSLSLFEAEIEFAKDVLATCRAASGPVFVMMDEIFHSTNAHDGVAASRVFLEQLYAVPRVCSLISTHYRELVENLKQHVQPWAMEVFEEEDALRYTYRVCAGISDKSSVMEILRERGLVSRKNTQKDS
jgi:hypothetical protein